MCKRGLTVFLKIRPFPASVSLFMSFPNARDRIIHSEQHLSKVGFEPRIDGLGSDRSANCATATIQWCKLFWSHNCPFVFILKQLFYLFLSWCPRKAPDPLDAFVQCLLQFFFTFSWLGGAHAGFDTLLAGSTVKIKPTYLFSVILRVIK